MTTIVTPIDFFGGCDGNANEKPYSLRYDPPGDFRRTNFISQAHDQSIQDIRGRENDFSVNLQGFGLLKLDPQMRYEDYDERAKVETVYFKQVAEGVQRMLGASRVQVFEHVVSRFDTPASHVCLTSRLAAT
jgi:hypothetical protein